jgi:hypothetical protein
MTTSNIAAMRRVSAYRTTDGSVHEDRDDAVRHQAMLDLQALLIQIHAQSATQPIGMVSLAEQLIDNHETVMRLLRLSQRGL